MKEKMYSIAFRKKISKEDLFWLHDDYEFIDCNLDTFGGRYWYADPFLFEKNNKVYLFFEQLDLIDRKGKVGYSILNEEEGTWSVPKIVIKDRCHFSFPYIFEHDGDVYIMPESCSVHSLQLFKALDFPDKWVVTEMLLSDVYACDSIFIKKKDTEYILTNEMYHNPDNIPSGNYASCWVKNYLYPLKGLNVIGDGVKIAEGDHGIRNAGKSFEINNTLYRIGQDCPNHRYGMGLVLFKVESLSPYREVEIRKWSCDDISLHIKTNTKEQIVGCHTYNSSDNYEVIDFSNIKKLNIAISLKRKLFFYKKAIKYVIKRVI